MGLSGGSIRYLVKGMTVGTWEQMVSQATQAPGIPPKNAPMLGGLKVMEHPRVVSVSGSTTATVEVTVGKEDDGGGLDTNEIQISYDTSVIDMQTQLDYSGKAILTHYLPGQAGRRATIERDNFNQCVPDKGFAVCQGGEVSKREPVDVLRMVRFETEPEFVIDKRDEFVGHTNKKKFWGKDKGAWLMTRMSVNFSVIDGELALPFAVTYEWQSKLDGWDKVAWYKIKESGNPPADAESFKPEPKTPRIAMIDREGLNQNFYNGYTLVRVQGSADFDTLELPKIR
jgi:hypothetical protein